MYVHTGPVHLDTITDFNVGVFPPIDWDWLVTQRTHRHPCILEMRNRKTQTQTKIESLSLPTEALLTIAYIERLKKRRRVQVYYISIQPGWGWHNNPYVN